MKRLPGLDFVRFYAAFSVLISHIAYYPRQWFDDPPVAEWLTRPFLLSGQHAVTLFFTLSGFLITYLLLNEQHARGSIDIRAFYKRRILRIWPLYFLVVLLSFVVFPLLFPITAGLPPRQLETIALVIFMLPNVAWSLVWNHMAAHLWTLGVEEQFYLFYPALVRLVKYLPLVLIIIVAFRWVLVALAYGTRDAALITIADGARFDCMAAGAFAAYLVQRRPWVMTYVYHPFSQALALLVIFITLIVPDFPIGPQYDLMRAGAFSVYLVNVSTNPRAWLRIDNRYTHLLGNLSYSIYMLHPAVIYLMYMILPRSAGFEAVMVISSTVITLAVSFVSYQYFERRFLAFRSPSLSQRNITVADTKHLHA